MDQPEPEAADAARGVAFGKYRLLRQLGEGAFGTVYEAILPGPMGFAKRVAVKTLRSGVFGAKDKIAEALVNEARIGGLLHHGNIVDILELGQVDGQYYMAMEFVDGPTLTEVIHACRMGTTLLPRFAVLAIGSDLCRGLHHAHGLRNLDGKPLRLVHRDVKPSNIILDAEGRAKILDFGIAKAATNLYQTTTSAVIKGTPRYMSPEQVECKPLDGRADMFSAAVVLYEMITNHLLFTADEMPGLLHQILFRDLTQSIERAETTMPGCGDILAKALARNPDHRQASAGQLADELTALSRDYPASATMGEVVARLMNRVADDRSFAPVRPEDLADDSTHSMQETLDPYPTGKPPDMAAAPDPALWDRFSTVFCDPDWPTPTPGSSLPPVAAPPRSEDPPAPRRWPRRPLAAVAFAALVLVGAWAAAHVWWGNPPELEALDADADDDADRVDPATPAAPTPEPPTPGAALPGQLPQDHPDGGDGHVDLGEQEPGVERERETGTQREADSPAVDPDEEEEDDCGGTAAAIPGAQPAQPGALRITCLQACSVYVDGKKHGSRTHMRTRVDPVEAGGHHLTLVRIDGEGNRHEKSFDLQVDGGEQFICWDFDRGAECG